MIEIQREEAVRRMNELGRAGRPFLFMIDYKQEHIYVETPERISPRELLFDLNGFTNLQDGEDERSASSGTLGDIEWLPAYPSFREYADSFQTVDDIRDFIAAERDAMSETDRQFMTVAIKADENVRMGIITDVKQELRRCSALKIMYTARKPAAD